MSEEKEVKHKFKKYITIDNNQGVIWEKLCERYPNSTIKKHEVDYVLKLFNEYIRENLLNEQDVRLNGIGIFKVQCRDSKTSPTGKQYHIVFKKSHNLTRRLRVAKGTATESELKSHAAKEEFIQNKWQGIKQSMLEKSGFKELKRVLTHYVDTSLDIKPIN